MVVANALIQSHVSARIGFPLAIGMTALLAATSWWLLEKPILRLKRAGLYVHRIPPTDHPQPVAEQTPLANRI